MADWSEADVEAKLREKDWFLSKDKIEYGVQFVLDDHSTRVNCYDSGKVVVQGKDTDLKRAAEQLFGQKDQSPTRQNSRVPVRGSVDAPTQVFIVYGRDKPARNELELLLLRLRLQPIVLENVPGAGDTIIEKLEDLTDADFACVLLTPDDEGRKKDPGTSGSEKLRPRARQNVVLELGMVLARLGRHRVAILVKGDDEHLERPSDVDGLLYIPFSEHVDEAKNALAANLQKAGFSINIEDLNS